MNRQLSIPLLALVPILFGGELAFCQRKSKLTDHFVLDQIRVFYTKEGGSAVSSRDRNRNEVPDQAEDVAKQVWAAHRLFCKVLEFPDPFESVRYKGITCIEVRLWDRKDINGVTGVAFESPQRARRIPEGKPTDRAIVMSIASQMDPIKNITPSHELFHLIQYGTTYFKNGWYLEGQARWAEHGLAKAGLGDVRYSPKGPWPQIPRHIDQLVKMGSKSEHVLWNPIAARTDESGLLLRKRLGPELVGLRYSDGSPVLGDRYLRGTKVMRDILIELGKQDDIAFKELGYKKWSEANQRSEKNNAYIYRAIMDAFRRHDPKVGRYDVPGRR